MMYNELFGAKKPLIGMIHTNSADEYTMLDLAKREIKIFLQHGIYPLIENYFGSTDECEMVLSWIRMLSIVPLGAPKLIPQPAISCM